MNNKTFRIGLTYNRLCVAPQKLKSILSPTDSSFSKEPIIRLPVYCLLGEGGGTALSRVGGLIIQALIEHKIPRRAVGGNHFYCFLTSPQQFLYFFPLPQGQGSLGLAFSFLRTGCFLSVPSVEPLVAVIFAVCSRFVSS